MMFGDKMTSLLRVVNVTSKPGDNVEQKFDTPMYKKVAAKEIEDIEIEVKTMTGEYVPFNYGEFIVTLSFVQTYG